MTNREVIALYYPLHYQRIMELSYTYYAHAWESWLDDPGDVGYTLVGSFRWRKTEEGSLYWEALFNGSNP